MPTMADTDTTTETTTEATTEGAWDADAAKSWEEQLIADMRAHGGRPSGGPLAGQALILLYTKGAKTGERRRSILTSSRDGDAWVVAGTASGAPKHPNWLFNIEADPNVTIEADNEEFPATATVFRDGPERDRLWDNHVQQLPWFAEYPKQVGDRTIPMVRLTRKG
jgi:deazaflavin-dependent oxidoreductase (nitroreductase family)